MSGVFLIQGYMIMTSAFISIPVYEKQKSIINLLKARGLKNFTYWIGHFIFDILMFIINSILIIVFFSDSLENVPYWTLLVTGVCLIIYAYCGSMIFNKLKTANSWFTIINSIFAFVFLPMIIFAEKSKAMVEGTFLTRIIFIKYFTPYYDLGYLIYTNSTQNP